VAVVLPVFCLLVVGAIDIGRAITVQYTLVEAARAGCRPYCVTEVLTEEESQAVIAKVMGDANIAEYTVDFDPYPQSEIEHLEPVTVTVSIPYDNVSFLPSWFLAGKTLSGTCILPGDTGEIDLEDDGWTPPDDGDDDVDDGGHGAQKGQGGRGAQKTQGGRGAQKTQGGRGAQKGQGGRGGQGGR